jgi:hypothetical protein
MVVKIRLHNKTTSIKRVFSKAVLGLVMIPLASLAQGEGFVPKVAVYLVHDNNIFRTAEKLSDTVATIAPTFAYKSLYGKQEVSAEYKGKYGFYSDNSNLNYLDHSISIKAMLKHSYKISSEFSASLEDKIEQAGTNNALNSQLVEFNQRSSVGLAGRVFYGNKQSTGQVVLGYGQETRRYDDNSQQFREYDKDKVTGTFFYRVAPKTRVLLTASTATYEYNNNQGFDQSSVNNNYLAGLEWSATAIISGVFKVGYQEVDYDDGLLSDLSGLSYILDMLWKPNSYSQVKISASSEARESAVQSVGGFLSDEVRIGLKHEFTRRTKFAIDYQYIEYDFDNSENRQDKLQGLSANLTYQAIQWLQLSLGAKTTKRESSSLIYEFDVNQINIGVVMSFN